MATILSMPKWGLAMQEGLIVAWLKKPGESVQQGEPIVQIESEKAVNDVEAPVSGILRRLEVEEGDSAPVSTAIAVITAPDEDLTDEQITKLIQEDAEERRQKAEALKQRSDNRAARAAKGAQTATMPRTASPGERINASPAARRLAQELGVDLTTITGTGPRGMIGREDVLRASEENNTATAEEQAAQEVQETSVEVDGMSIHYIVAGPPNAPHLLFIHGLGGTIATWSLNLETFAQNFRICALDMIGAGSSATPMLDYSIATQAAFVARFLDTLGADWQRVTLVGHSLGGAVALAFAQNHPERVEKLILLDSAGLGPEIDETLLHLIHSKPNPENIRAELSCFFVNSDLVQQAMVDLAYKQRTQPGAYEALVATSDASFKDGRQLVDLRDALNTFPEPVLLVWGACDKVIPATNAQHVSSPNVRVEVFQNCGHCPHIESSEAFNQLATAFLSGT